MTPALWQCQAVHLVPLQEFLWCEKPFSSHPYIALSSKTVGDLSLQSTLSVHDMLQIPQCRTCRAKMGHFILILFWQIIKTFFSHFHQSIVCDWSHHLQRKYLNSMLNQKTLWTTLFNSFFAFPQPGWWSFHYFQSHCNVSSKTVNLWFCHSKAFTGIFIFSQWCIRSLLFMSHCGFQFKYS